MVKILYWRTVWRMTQRYPVISLMITLHNMNQHSICSRRAIVNRYASGYRKVRWQQGIVGRDLSSDAGRDLAEVKQFHMATGDDHYTDLASLLNDHFKSGKPDFDVLICGNDRAAFVAYQVLLAKGVRIPQDVAVMGFDNLVGVGHLFLPPLTTIQLPHDIIGREAALHIIEGREGGRVTRIPCPLLIRCST